MDEPNMETCLLKYLQKELDDPNISYVNPPKSLSLDPEWSKVYSFQLKNAPKNISGRLVLRVNPEHSPLKRAQMEGILHNYLANNGYPAPPVHFICSDPSILGGTFTIMEHLPGESLASYNQNIPEILAQVTLDLHRIDSEPLRQSLLSAGIKEELFTGLGEREDYIHSHNLHWLKPALGWIHENRPKADDAICHGDIHAGNVLVENGKLSCVFDWESFKIDDPCRDLGSTVILYSVLVPRSRPERTLEYASRLEDYLNLIRSQKHIDSWKLEYYQAVRCLWVMAAPSGRVNQARSMGIIDAVIERFNQITGIEVKPEKS
jgi:aminoglycoside phosphotransferase (APT) family kinase protein